MSRSFLRYSVNGKKIGSYGGNNSDIKRVFLGLSQGDLSRNTYINCHTKTGDIVTVEWYRNKRKGRKYVRAGVITIDILSTTQGRYCPLVTEVALGVKIYVFDGWERVAHYTIEPPSSW